MLSRAPRRPAHTRTLRDRTGSAVLALLVQGLFVLALVMTRTTPQMLRSPAKETLLLFHAMPKSAPPQPATMPDGAQRPAIPLIVPNLPSTTLSPSAPPSGIAGFGRSLFGCAPEQYADLPPEERARCPKPGEGLATNQPPDLLNPPKSHARDEALWQEEQQEARWNTQCAGAQEVAKCMMHQAMAENRRVLAARQHIADEKTSRLQEPKRPLPAIGVRRN